MWVLCKRLRLPARTMALEVLPKVVIAYKVYVKQPPFLKFMRLKSEAELKTMLNDGSISESAAKQLRVQFASIGTIKAVSQTAQRPRKPKPRLTATQSEGEAVLALALRSQFRHWHDGGEFVEELVVYPGETKIRVDFALPRWQVYIEVEGWTHHGRSIEDHHADRDRLNFLSSRNWHRFAVTHAQATKSAMKLVEQVDRCLRLRTALARDAICVSCRELPSGQHWHELSYKQR